MATLVLLRHGESEANAGNRFAGWDDVPLTPRGRDEAWQAGRWLLSAGVRLDAAHASVLQRAVDTRTLVLQALGRPGMPVLSTWRLNERHYGALQGWRRDDAQALHGAAAVSAWRRSREARPPSIDDATFRSMRNDPRYAGLCDADLPRAESLRDTERRLWPYWQEILLPLLMQGASTLVVSHGNTLRALRRLVEQMPDHDECRDEIATGMPLVYELRPDGWGRPHASRAG